MVQFDEWFDENVKKSHFCDLFISWLENRGMQITSFKPEVLEEEWLLFLFYLSAEIAKVTDITEEDVYYETKYAGNKELLDASVHYWCKPKPEDGFSDSYDNLLIERWMRLGFALAQKDGWKHIAPAWLEDWRKHIEIPF